MAEADTNRDSLTTGRTFTMSRTPAQNRKNRKNRRFPTFLRHFPTFRQLLSGRAFANTAARLVGYTKEGASETLVSLALLSVSSVVAGVLLGKNTDRLEELPGLLLMVPAAIALRGNIFGAVGARLGTAIHAGTYRMSFRPASVVGENIVSSLLLNLLMSVALALLGKAFAVVFGVSGSISTAEFIAISVTGGVLASIVVLAVALLLAMLSVRYRWDPDNVTVPLVTSAGDVITLPSLFVTIWFFDIERFANLLTPIYFGIATGLAVLIWQGASNSLRRILNESIPVLLAAIIFDMFAGIVVESRLDKLALFPSLLILLPGYLAVAGSLGAILSSRLSTKFHLGVAQPNKLPDSRARADLVGIALLALPGYIILALVVEASAEIFSVASPGILDLLGVVLLGGVVVVAVVAAVAYYGTMVSVRVGVNPDTYGIPIITAVLDLVGAFVLILAIDLLGIV